MATTRSDEAVEEETRKRRKHDLGTCRPMDLMVTDSDINDVSGNANLLHHQLQQLYIQLGLKASTIENAERGSDSKYPMHQAIHVLRSWRQSNGVKATRKAIIDALIECSLIEAKDILVNKWTLTFQDYHLPIETSRDPTPLTSRYQHHEEPLTSQDFHLPQQLEMYKPTEQLSFPSNSQQSSTAINTAEIQPPMSNFPPAHYSCREQIPSFAHSSSFGRTTSQNPPPDFQHVHPGSNIDYSSAASTTSLHVGYHHPTGNTTLQQQAHVPLSTHGPVSQGFRQNSLQTIPAAQHTYQSQSLSSTQIETSPTTSSGQQGYHPLGNTTLQQQLHVPPPAHGPVSQGCWQNSPQKIPASKHTYQSQSLSSTQIETLPTTSSGNQVYISPVFNLTECKKELVTYYRHEMRRVQVLPWCDDSRDMNDIYVTLKLQNRSGKGTTSLSNNEALVCIKSSQGEPETRILLKGVAGSGKSTLLAKLAYTWAEQKNGSPLANFELLFILSLREVINISLIDELFEQIFETNTKVSKDGLEEYIESHPQSILLLLDGFDEYSASDLSNPVGSLQEILTFKSFRDCYTILSTRPHKDLQNYQSSYVLVDVLGFSRKNVKLYMQRFFNGKTDVAQGLQERIEESERLMYLSKIPVILMLMCLLWEDEQKLADTQTELYQEFVFFLWRKYCIRCGKTVDLKSKIDGEFEQFILRIGQVALDGLCSKENTSRLCKEEKLVFTDNDFDNSFQLGYETGLLSRERLRSRLSAHTAVTFLHQSFQEFCAATYWANLYATDPDQFRQILSRLKSWTVLMSKFELVKFCCGLVELGGVSFIIRHAIDVYMRISHPEDICIGYYKPEDGKKNIVNILILLSENDSFTPQSQIRHQCQQKCISRTECSLNPPQKDCVTVRSHKSSLTKPFKSIFPDDGFTIAVANKYPKAISIFQNFVRSELGLSILSTVKSISFVNPHLSQLVIGDTLRCMLNVQDVTFKFTEVDNNAKSDLGDPIQSAVKSISFVNPHISARFMADILKYIPDVQDVNVTFSEFDHIDQVGVMLTDNLGKLLDKLSKFEIQMISDIRLKVSVPLHQLVSFTYRGNYTHVMLERVRFAVFNMNELLSGSTNLRLFALKDISITLGDMDLSVDEINDNDNRIEDLSIEYIADCKSNNVQYKKDITEPRMYKLKVGRFSLSETIASAFYAHIFNPHIQVIECANDLREAHIKMFSEYLPKALNLQMLDLSHNNIGMAIGQLQYCTKLTSLNLSNTQLEEEHIKILSEFLHKISNLQELDVSWNNVGMAIGPLAQQLQFCPMLSKLILRDAHIPDEGVIELLQRFVSLPNLTHLDLWPGSEYFGNHVVDALFKHIHHLTKLQYLKFDCKLGNACSDRVKDCLAAIGERLEYGTGLFIRMKSEELQLVRSTANKYL
ncbi:NLR family CARD domain-containing protein 4-like [Amphiura filiformis]|uniref:NLR family CARD domain-containing protein 4-like n=1 Tax=Amphiura filiformis TaxID=82378 RepID=UPI003B21E060